ncbi:MULTISPECIES: GEVED domain-containing protein [Bizionia]|uniref:T9SS type A sorting domain-containing protein n=1 Tax=Bizionia algoritergicola TaxID=291187 RepID=A0A5D0QPN9_9FLAO|nr:MULTISPECIES: GEVED domain-containing protein [Bizionia]OBX22280.1 hypothetical protein BAA08_09315 [Bizionia sp. APA-3]TYB70826.1 T9SS type A sorting domain-containing protein [Bizionia algoritergicola]
MKKFTLLFFTFILCSYSYAQCDFDGNSYASLILANSGNVEEVDSCNFFGEYSDISNLTIGDNYEFAAAGGFITIIDAGDGVSVLASGVSPLSWVATVGAVEAHWAADAACTSGSSCVVTTVQNLDGTPQPAPANDECVNAETISCGDTVSGQTLTATNSGNNTANDVWYVLAGTANGEEITASLCGSDYDTLIRVFDACAGTQVAFNDDASGVCSPQSQVTFTSDGATTYYIMVEGFGSNNGNFDLAITCVPPPACVPATFTLANGVNNCPTEEFFIDVVVTNLGTGLSVDISDDSGVLETAVGLGTYSVGPYAASTVVNFTVEDAAGDTCNATDTFTTIAACPPSNDECSNATALTVDPDYSCASVVSGTTIAATQSLAGCSGTANDDVWYSFVATSTDHRITITNTGGATDIVTQVFDSCGGASLVCQDTPNSPINLSGLTPTNTYFFRIYTYSSSASTRTSFDVCVGTAPTCYVPEDLVASFVAPNMADLTWSAPTNGTAPASYNWEVVPQGSPQGTGVVASGNVAGTAASATGLTPDTLYDFYVQSDCGGGDLSAFAGPVTFNAGYCIPSGTNVNTYIDTFTTTGPVSNINNTASGLSTDNYGDFYASQSVALAAEQTFDFNVEIVSGTVGCAIWIDWNNDFIFDEATETVFNTTGFGSGPFTGTVTVPSGTANGDYRLRVMIDWNDSNPSEDACGLNSGRGEVEDYKLIVDSTLSTDSFDSPNAFTYYPNPVSNVLNVKAQNNISNVAVYNMLGQEVLRTAPNTVASEVDMSNLQTGAYFVKVTIGNATKTIRVIKN